MAADLFGSFNRIVKNISWNFLLTKFGYFFFVIKKKYIIDSTNLPQTL